MDELLPPTGRTEPDGVWLNSLRRRRGMEDPSTRTFSVDHRVVSPTSPGVFSKLRSCLFCRRRAGGGSPTDEVLASSDTPSPPPHADHGGATAAPPPTTSRRSASDSTYGTAVPILHFEAPRDHPLGGVLRLRTDNGKLPSTFRWRHARTSGAAPGAICGPSSISSRRP